jgi:hypothetical protein
MTSSSVARPVHAPVVSKDDEQRRHEPPAALADEEPAVLVPLRDAQVTACQPEHRIPIRAVPFPLSHHHGDAGREQERTEDVHRPVKHGEQREAANNEDCARDNGSDDAPEEHLVMVGRGRLELNARS